ncbi:MAG: LemA family protein [Flavobacteriales bacterium]|nr:LemA family protein [Flavobacteriales bacterium]MCB9448264.1 LemA family protein [Flavobacteriales bacterium]
MKKSHIIWGVCGLLVLFLIFAVPNAYNKAVKLQEDVKAEWADVQATYQRRADLIPNLVSTVKGYADHEENVLVAVTEARAKATSMNIDASNLNAENLKKFQDAQAGLSSALSRLLVTVEKYPDLKANQNFLELQAQLEGTENRIAVARENFNAATKSYNTHLRRFPAKIFIGWMADDGEFEAMQGFEAEASSAKAPEVKF